MSKINIYINYGEKDFVNDESFQNWAWGRGCEQDELFWKRFQDAYPEKKAVIERAAKVLREIPFNAEFEGEEPSDERVGGAFEETKRRLGFRVSKGRMIRISKTWWAAAAILLLMLAGGYFLLNPFKDKEIPRLANTDGNDIQPGGNKAILTLASGTVIILDSTNIGKVTKEGNVTIIKLDDGRLAYQSSTASYQPSTVLYNTITTPRGGQYQLTLEDGTKVWLNAESSLRYPASFVGNERKVQLSGEGYFEVAKNEKMPFYVTVGDMNVKVLGTHFNINAYSDEDAVRTTLLEGSVKVGNEKRSVILRPGEQAMLQVTNSELLTTNNVDMDEVMAWKNGYFLFNSADIKTILRDAARWYDADVIYEGDVNETFSGGLQRSENISQLLKILEATGKVKFIIDKKQIIVQPK